MCLDSLATPVITHCAHVFCRRCIEDVIKTSEHNPRCPLCRGCIGMDVLVEVPPDSEDVDMTDASEEWHSSSKVCGNFAFSVTRAVKNIHCLIIVDTVSFCRLTYSCLY